MDEARRERDEAIALAANLQQQIAELQARPQAARLQEREERIHLLTIKISEQRQQLVQLQQDKADAERGLRSQAESLRRERDELLEQQENLGDLLGQARDRVLKSWRTHSGPETRGRIKEALERLVSEVLSLKNEKPSDC